MKAIAFLIQNKPKRIEVVKREIKKFEGRPISRAAFIAMLKPHYIRSEKIRKLIIPFHDYMYFEYGVKTKGEKEKDNLLAITEAEVSKEVSIGD